MSNLDVNVYMLSHSDNTIESCSRVGSAACKILFFTKVNLYLETLIYWYRREIVNPLMFFFICKQMQILNENDLKSRQDSHFEFGRYYVRAKRICPPDALQAKKSKGNIKKFTFWSSI